MSSLTNRTAVDNSLDTVCVKRANPEGVTPAIPGRQSMTRLEAVAILAHPQVRLIPNVLVDEARKVEKEGEHWVWA